MQTMPRNIGSAVREGRAKLRRIRSTSQTRADFLCLTACQNSDLEGCGNGDQSSRTTTRDEGRDEKLRDLRGLLAQIDARDAVIDVREDFPGDGSTPIGQLAGSNGFLALRTDQHN